MKHLTTTSTQNHLLNIGSVRWSVQFKCSVEQGRLYEGEWKWEDLRENEEVLG